MGKVEPYNIAVSESKFKKLHEKLLVADFPDELDEAGWDYGAPLADVKRLTSHWKYEFDWREQEAKLNQLPQFHTGISIDGFETLDIHFLHQRSDVDGAIPLLFCHGCMSHVLIDC